MTMPERMTDEELKVLFDAYQDGNENVDVARAAMKELVAERKRYEEETMRQGEQVEKSELEDDVATPVDREAFEDACNLEQELEHLLNRCSAENDSDTPDYILARFLMQCLEAWNRGVCARREWYSDAETTDQWRNQRIGDQG